MYSLQNKVVIVTGASRGIGASLTAILRQKGSRLVLTARDESKLNGEATPGNLIVAGDITEEQTRHDIVRKAVERFGQIDVLINNAGRGSYYPASETPLDDARSLMELNLIAPFHLAQLATPHLLKSQGTLVNVSSIAGQISLPWLPLYSASKFALASLTAAQRMELRRQGVNVMAVYPGYVHTDFQDHASGTKPPGAVVKGKRFAITSDGCAAAIVAGIERRRRTVVTPRMGWLLIWANRLFPGLVESRLETV